VHGLAALADDRALLREAERREQLAVEGEAALERGDDQVDVVETAHGPQVPAAQLGITALR
jgi:hypothetical protein